MLSNDLSLFEKLKGELQSLFGPSDMESPVWLWEHTDYYTEEMGRGLRRFFVVFKELINPENIVQIKLKTIELERQYLNDNGGRRINLDPGYLDMAKVILVSTKDFSHRIYLGSGIYGEVTLSYSNNEFRPMPYTYPDFRTEGYREFFKKARSIYRNEVKKLP
jgi:hypothetical protein